MHEGKIVQQTVAGVADPYDQHDAKNQHADFAGRAVEFLIEYARWCSGRCGSHSYSSGDNE
jgi:hypothetical protein